MSFYSFIQLEKNLVQHHLSKHKYWQLIKVVVVVAVVGGGGGGGGGGGVVVIVPATAAATDVVVGDVVAVVDVARYKTTDHVATAA